MHTYRSVLAYAVLCVALCGLAAGNEDDHDGHDHGGDAAFEWSGTFAVPDSRYLWAAQAVDGAYANPTMKMVVLNAPEGGTETELLELAEEAGHGFEEDCTDVEVGGIITPTEDACFRLVFMEGSTLDSTFYIATEGVSHVAIFAEHFPTEFENTEHFLKSLSGEDIDPIASTPSDDHDGHDHPSDDHDGHDHGEEGDSKPWGTAIGAAIIVNIVTFVGMVLLVPVVSTLVKQFPQAFDVSLNSFAAGALLGAAVFLLLHEATHLVTADSESEAAAAWGCMILLGFITSSLFDIIVSAIAPEITTAAPRAAEDEATLKGPPPVVDNGIVHSQPLHQQPQGMFHPQPQGMVPQQPQGMVPWQQPQGMATIPMVGPYGGIAVVGNAFGIYDEDVDRTDAVLAARRSRVLTGVLIGDFMHNFCDGIFIGTAFSLCSNSLGWSITAATVYHEIAQEVSDFIVLTDKNQGGLKPLIALALNFLSGTSVIIGVLVVLSQELTNYETGMILAYGGGVYVQIAAAECMPRVYIAATNLRYRFLSFFAFFIGAMAIGLVLLDHEHCGGHDGHDHGGGHDGHNH